MFIHCACEVEMKLPMIRCQITVVFCTKFTNTWGERGCLGSFLHVWLIWKYFLLLNSRFLRKEDIAPCKKVIDLWRLAVRQLPYIEIYRGNLGKIWSFWSIFFCILTFLFDYIQHSSTIFNIIWHYHTQFHIFQLSKYCNPKYLPLIHVVDVKNGWHSLLWRTYLKPDQNDLFLVNVCLTG